ncbi:MAG: phosphoenolpyruvate mutase [Butyrivibrio sp.]|nr:phosphoenolpyruvate mutase [Butyrivibrio sp.]
MKALILNSGIGKRMGDVTKNTPKCMSEISENETILSRQLIALNEIGIEDVVITIGPFAGMVVDYCLGLNLPLNIKFIKNTEYENTNYIYSIFLAKEYLDDDILILHGDLVFEDEVLQKIVSCENDVVVVNSLQPLSDKDFKAVIKDNRVVRIGVDCFNDALNMMPMYKLSKNVWSHWLDEICRFIACGERNCYAEEALNGILDSNSVVPLNIGKMFCAEVDTIEDLTVVKAKAREIKNHTVYMCFSTDIIHSGHIALIRKAERLGKLIIGVLSDEAVISYKRFPLLPFSERKAMFSNIAGVSKVVEQKTLSYKENLKLLRPDFVVHGDDWKTGFQKVIRDEVTDVLSEYGGILVEYPYARDEKYIELEKRSRSELSLPDVRRGRLKKAIEMKGLVTALEAHNGLTGLIAEKTSVTKNGELRQFDAMWISSLCDSTSKGKPDIEVVDMSSRFKTVDEILEVTTKPIIFDGDTGGLTEHFVYTVRTLERIGVSMVIIEDKTGLKKNSLFGTDVIQVQESIEKFCQKLKAGKQAQKSSDFMICARIESLILEKGMDDALERARAYCDAGADAIMIHSRKKDPGEIFCFVKKFRDENITTPIVVVPTSYNVVFEEQLKAMGVNVVIYANQLTRSGFLAMEKAAKLILSNQRAKECDDICMPIKDIITLIPEQ